MSVQCFLDALTAFPHSAACDDPQTTTSSSESKMSSPSAWTRNWEAIAWTLPSKAFSNSQTKNVMKANYVPRQLKKTLFLKVEWGNWTLAVRLAVQVSCRFRASPTCVKIRNLGNQTSGCQARKQQENLEIGHMKFIETLKIPNQKKVSIPEILAKYCRA